MVNEKVISFINQALEEGLEGRRFQNKKIHGLATRMPRIDGARVEIIPVVLDDDFEGHYVGMDDDFDLIMYHTISNTVVKKSLNKGFGDADANIVNATDVSLVIYGKASTLCVSADGMGFIIQGILPDKFNAKIDGVSFVDIQVKSIKTDTLVILQEEFQGFNFKIGPENFLVKINYTIESTFSKRCFNTCN
ncbi:MAG: hypothetical protein K1X55_17475 [Chitinophagales bacterium]|nr:hypothetical protein [Chitinophagales bacterium]